MTYPSTPDTFPDYVAVRSIEHDGPDDTGWTPVEFTTSERCSHGQTMCPECVHGGWSDDYDIGRLPRWVHSIDGGRVFPRGRIVIDME